MQSHPDDGAPRAASERPKSKMQRFLDALNEFDKALDDDPLLELSAKVARLEREISEIKQLLLNKPS